MGWGDDIVNNVIIVTSSEILKWRLYDKKRCRDFGIQSIEFVCPYKSN